MASHGPRRIGIQRANFTISLTSKSTQPYQRGRASITGLRRIKAESLTAESSKNPEFRTAVPSFDQKSKIITRKSPQTPSPPFHRPGSAPPRFSLPIKNQKSKIITRKSPQNPSPPFHRPGSAPPRLSPTSDLHFLPFDVPRWKFDVRCSPSSIVPAPRPPRPPRPLRGKLFPLRPSDCSDMSELSHRPTCRPVKSGDMSHALRHQIPTI